MMSEETKIAIIPIDSADEDYLFHQTVSQSCRLEELEPLLFPKLFSLLKDYHPNNLVRIWGTSPGEKSIQANIWSSLNRGDAAFFVQGGKVLGSAQIQTTFQSDNVGEKLWPNLADKVARQYLVTFGEYKEQGDKDQSEVLKIFKKFKVELENFNSFSGVQLRSALENKGLLNDQKNHEINGSIFEYTLTQILDLQREYSSKNTDAMKNRGELIRTGIPKILQENFIEKARTISQIQDLEITGNDAVGL
jgi:hypothetical protein